MAGSRTFARRMAGTSSRGYSGKDRFFAHSNLTLYRIRAPKAASVAYGRDRASEDWNAATERQTVLYEPLDNHENTVYKRGNGKRGKAPWNRR